MKLTNSNLSLKKDKPTRVVKVDSGTKKSAALVRNAISFFERFETHEVQELLARSPLHWLLSTEEFRLPIDPPVGLISKMLPLNEMNAVFLVPTDDEFASQLDYRIIHQVYRELTYGIFVFNETPTLSLNTNYDQSTTCQIPPAYVDTLIGQSMITVDYAIKTLWHGVFFPKDKRMKFADKWRSQLNVNSYGLPESKNPIHLEFANGGLKDIIEDHDYEDAYSEIPESFVSDEEAQAEKEYFISVANNTLMQITFYQELIQQHNCMFVVNSNWFLSSAIKIFDEQFDSYSKERLMTHLQIHEEIIRQSLTKKPEIRRALFVLKLVSFLTPLFVALRKRLQIPAVEKFLPPLVGENVHTERELPPIIIGPKNKCPNFYSTNMYTNLHGGVMINLETPLISNPPQEIIDLYADLCSDAEEAALGHLDKDKLVQMHYQIPTRTINNQRYMLLFLPTEIYYVGVPYKPPWVGVFVNEMNRLRPRKLPVTEPQMVEQIKKLFGLRGALKSKTTHNGLVQCSERGLVAIFIALCRKITPARLIKADENGFSYMHHAALSNSSHIIGSLVLNSIDVNIKQHQHFNKGGITPLHIAASIGAVDALSCLLSNYASLTCLDTNGWMPIHHAAYCNQLIALRLLIQRSSSLLNIQADNINKSTPLLLAATAGSLACFKFLLASGADVDFTDGNGDGIIHLSTLHLHTHVLRFLIDTPQYNIDVWSILISMLSSEFAHHRLQSVKCLELLTVVSHELWQPLLLKGGIPALVTLLEDSELVIQQVTCSVLCNISEQPDVRQALTDANASSAIIGLLSSKNIELQSRASIVLADMSLILDNKVTACNNGAIEALTHLMESDVEEVLVNSCNALRVLSDKNSTNQSHITSLDMVVNHLVEYLSISSEVLQSAASAAIAALSESHCDNQDLFISAGVVTPLVALLKSNNICVQVKAALCIQKLCGNNPSAQAALIQQDAHHALMKLLKNINLTVREQGAVALWALTGTSRTQKLNIATNIGIPLIIQMLLESTEKLLLVGCESAIAMGYESFERQKKLADADVFVQLVRLLRAPRATVSVKKIVVRVMGILCLGIAYRNNTYAQKKLADENALKVMEELFQTTTSVDMKIEISHSMACLILSNHENQEKLRENTDFKVDYLLLLLYELEDKELILRAVMALAIFAFNNTEHQFAICQAGGLNYSVLEAFLTSYDPHEQCYAAFQLVVLARVINNHDQVSLTAQGVTILVQHLNSHVDTVIVLAASLLSSLAHTRAGIPDAMVTMGVVETMVRHLYSSANQVKESVAIGLGYLTFNKTAARILLSLCRNKPGLYELFTETISKEAKICKDFIANFRQAKTIGLPSESLEINGGPPAVIHGKRPVTSIPASLEHPEIYIRAKSAPAKLEMLRNEFLAVSNYVKT